MRAGIEEGASHPGDPEAMAMMGIAIMQVQLSRAIELGESDAGRLSDEVFLHLRRLLGRPEQGTETRRVA